MRVLPVNSNTVLVELDDLAQTLGLLGSLQSDPIDGIDEIVPGARTLMIAFEPARLDRTALVTALAGRPLTLPEADRGTRVEIPVHYDGEDLADVAALLGLSTDEVVRRHTGKDWFVAFTGFAPGFAYLSHGDASLAVPRRTSPRTRIPPGAVALAGGFSGIYPKASPGGWQLIGQTFTPMWDLQRKPPALLAPGQWVRFVDAGPRPAARSSDQATANSETDALAGPATAIIADAAARPAIGIHRPGLQALLQDLGRPGQAGQGVAASGAMDRRSLQQANRLVGNPAGLAAIEVALGGFELRSHGATVVAVTGAEGPLTLIPTRGSRRAAPRGEALALDDGDRLRIGEPLAGVRSYVAVRGGFDLEPVLGSLSFDTLAQVGPAPLFAGQRLPLRALDHGGVVGLPEPPVMPWPCADDIVELDVTPGPRTDWFRDDALARLTGQPWRVTPQSNRVGLRLNGEQALQRVIHDELPSEGTATGAIQVPANGQPVLFLVDHPLTGGYPVIACVVPGQLALAGQIPVGAWIHFRVVSRFAPLDVPAQAAGLPAPAATTAADAAQPSPIDPRRDPSAS